MATAKGYNQEEGIDYEETYTPVAHLEAIRLLLAFACFLDFKLCQMDVKFKFLNDLLDEEVYVSPPSGFEDLEHPDYIFKLKKALYESQTSSQSLVWEIEKVSIEKGILLW